MSANESEVGSPESRLREAKKQISIVREELDDIHELQVDLGGAEEIVGNVATALAIDWEEV